MIAGEEEGQHFAFLLIDDYSLLNVAASIDPLRDANRKLGKKFYKWSLVTADGGVSRSSCGFDLKADCSLDNLGSCDILFVCAGLVKEPPDTKRVLGRLRERARRGTAVGGISVGSHMLAKAGLLNGYRCTIHWENCTSFSEEFPDVECTGTIFEIDRKRFTSAGGTASIDMMLQIIREDLGVGISTEVANTFQHERIRTHIDRQRVGPERDLAGKSQKLQRAVELMADNLEEPMTALEIAKRVGLSLRQVERLFLRHLNCTPGRYYMRVRLERSRELLRHTNAPILEVALSTGFTSHSYFAQSYRHQFGRSPSEERRAND